MRKRLMMLMLLLPMAVVAEPLDKVVAVVNDDVITASELEQQATILRQQIMARKVEMPSEQALKKQVLQHLIDETLQLQAAKFNQMTIDNIELDEAIEKIAKSNKLTLNELREALLREGITFDNYRDRLRKEMLISRIQQSALAKDINITAKQIDDYLAMSSRTDKAQHLFSVQNMLIPLPEEPTSEQLSKARKKAEMVLQKAKKGGDFTSLAIAESTNQFILEGGDLGERHLAELPDVFAEKIVNMQEGEVVGPIRTGNGFQLIKLVKIKAAEVHHDVVKTHVRHILLKQAASMTEAEAKKQIENLYQQLKSGKDFAVMAKKYSLDQASAIKGGDMGWVISEELVPAFAEAMNELPLHQVSKPVKSLFGWHLIEVLERKTVDDSVAFQRQQVHQFLHQRKFAEAVQNWQQHMRSSAFVNIVDENLA